MRILPFLCAFLPLATGAFSQTLHWQWDAASEMASGFSPIYFRSLTLQAPFPLFTWPHPVINRFQPQAARAKSPAPPPSYSKSTPAPAAIAAPDSAARPAPARAPAAASNFSSGMANRSYLAPAAFSSFQTTGNAFTGQNDSVPAVATAIDFYITICIGHPWLGLLYYYPPAFYRQPVFLTARPLMDFNPISLTPSEPSGQPGEILFALPVFDRLTTWLTNF